MSWDIFVFDLPKDAKTIDDIPKDFKSSSIGKRSEIVSTIVEVYPAADFSDPEWGTLDGDGWSIELHIGPEEQCESFAFYVRGGGGAVDVVAAILQRLDLKAIDSQTGDFFAAGEGAAESFGQWNQYRDMVIKDNARSTDPIRTALDWILGRHRSPKTK